MYTTSITEIQKLKQEVVVLMECRKSRKSKGGCEPNSSFADEIRRDHDRKETIFGMGPGNCGSLH